ncbi:FecR domain-containing protein [Duganella sp. PWIR1]
MSGDALPEAILTEAATWLMEMHEGPLPAARREQLDAWRQRSPQHERAWEKAAVLLSKFDALPSPGAHALRKLSMPERRRTVKVLAALLVAAPGAWLAYRNTPWLQPAGSYRTAVGERRDVTLADGTRITLNTDTEIVADFNHAHRLIHLRGGEVLITTAADSAQPPRPFLVAVSEGRIRALGTRFVVRQREAESRVSVFSGAVEVSPSDAQPVVITTGKQATFSRASVSAPGDADDNSIAWQNGMLVVDRMPMAQFLAELGRYRRGMLRGDEAIAGLLVSGAFPLTDTDFTLSLIAQTMPVRVSYLSRYWVRVLPA